MQADVAGILRQAGELYEVEIDRQCAWAEQAW